MGMVTTHRLGASIGEKFNPATPGWGPTLGGKLVNGMPVAEATVSMYLLKLLGLVRGQADRLVNSDMDNCVQHPGVLRCNPS